MNKLLLFGVVLAGMVFGLVQMELKEQIVAHKTPLFSELFKNRNIIIPRLHNTPLPLGPGSHYLTRAEISRMLVKALPGQEIYEVTGNGIQIHIRTEADVGSNYSIYEQETISTQTEATPGSAQGLTYFLFPSKFSSFSTIPKGTSVIIYRSTSRLKIQYNGHLASDFNPDNGEIMKIKLLNTDNILNKRPKPKNIAFF